MLLYADNYLINDPLKRKTNKNWAETYKLNPPKMFNIIWREKFAKEFDRLNRRDLRVATQILTVHVTLNYHLSKLYHTVEPICPLCKTKEETVSHFLGQCPMRRKLRTEFFDTYYTTATDIIDRCNFRQIINSVHTTQNQAIGTLIVTQYL